MGVSGELYRFVLLLHILTVVVAFGSFMASAAWVSLSFLLFIVAAVLLVAVVIPTQRRSNQLTAESVANRSPETGRGEMVQLDKKLAATSGVFNLLFLAILALMIFKPGA